MAVAVKEGIEDSEHQKRLRQSIADIRTLVTSPEKSDLTNAVESMEKLGVRVRQELREMAAPRPGHEPMVGQNLAEPSAEEISHQAKIVHAVNLLEQARLARNAALAVLSTMALR